MKKTVLLFAAFFAIAACLSACGNSEPTEATETTVPPHKLVENQLYARDEKECMAYRVVIADGSTEDDMQVVFKSITNGDGYYLHTVWYYGLESDVDKSLGYTVGMIDETEKNVTEFSKPSLSAEDIEFLRNFQGTE